MMLPLRSLVCSLVLATTLAVPAQAKGAKAAAPKSAPAALPAPVKVTSVEGITEYQLANGLRVLLFPDPSKPSMTVNITYLVGSRHENYGETGMAHLLEHLQFKGTDRHPDVPKILNSLGARFNGSTWFDRTNYFVTFPASEENLEIALDLEADRMVNSHIWKKDLWDEKEQKGEMTVVRNEMESGENDPIGVTTDRMSSVAFDWHNYGKSAIGARSDVENVNIEHLQAFYHRYYQPDNAYLLVAGQIDEAKTLMLINEKFGRIPKPVRVLEKTWTVEPVQDGERSVTVRRIGGTPFLGIGYHVPQSASLDSDALGLVTMALDESPSGRLYQALVAKKLAARVSDQTVTTLEPGFLEFLIELPKDGDIAAARSAALAVIEGIREKPLTQEELDRAKASASKSFDLITQRTDAFAIALSEAIAAGDWRLLFVGRDHQEAMTLAQAQAAAENYFKPSNRTVGEYIPTDKPDRAQMPPALDIAAELKGYRGRAQVAQGEAFDPSPKNIEARVTRFTAKNGLQGALLAKKTKGGSVSVALSLRFGSEETLQNLGAAPALAAEMLVRGSALHTRQQIKDELDKLKAQLTINGDAESAHAQLITDRAHLPAALRLLAELLRKPAFPAEELATLRAEAVTELEASQSEPQVQAVTAMQIHTSPYPKGHPRAAKTPEESIAELKAVTLEQLKAFHASFYGAEHAQLAIVGDFDPAATQALIEEQLGDWKSGKPYARIAARRKDAAAFAQELQTPDKANAFFIANETMALKDSDADFAALCMANEILGGGALKSRLADRIRQKEGISYGVGSQLMPGRLDPVTTWITYAIYAPQNESRLEQAFHEELVRAQGGFTAEELAFVKNAWLQGRQVARTQDSALASRLAEYLYFGRTMAFDEAFEAKVAQLTLDEVNAAYKKWIDPAKISIFKAGDFKAAAK